MMGQSTKLRFLFVVYGIDNHKNQLSLQNNNIPSNANYIRTVNVTANTVNDIGIVKGIPATVKIISASIDISAADDFEAVERLIATKYVESNGTTSIGAYVKSGITQTIVVNCSIMYLDIS